MQFAEKWNNNNKKYKISALKAWLLRNSEFLVAFVKLQEAHQIKSNSTQCETQGNPAIHIVFVFSVCSSQTNLDGPPTLLKKNENSVFRNSKKGNIQKLW